MAKISHPLIELKLSGNVYLAKAPEAPADGDLRLNPPENPENNPQIKVEFLWEGQWRPLISWLFSGDLQRYQSTWPDPLAVIMIYQRLLRFLHPHLEIERHPKLGYGLNIRDVSYEAAYRYIMAAYGEACDLHVEHRPKA